MRSLSVFLFVLVTGFSAIGCDSDSSDNGPSDSERLVGNWIMSGVTDADGDQWDIFSAGFNSVVISFTQSGNYSIVIDSKLPDGDTTISGMYTVNEGTNSIALATEVAGQSLNLNFTYAFSSDTQATFTADPTTSTLLNVLLGTTLRGTISLILTKI